MARATAEAKEQTRRRLVAAAGRAFRAHGYGGVGVDALAKAAGVTSGALYAHYPSKGAIFAEALRTGLGELRDGIAVWRTRGTGWLRRFAAWYLGPERRADLAGSCALPTLSLEAARGDAETRALYDAELRAIVAELAAGMRGRDAESRAIAVLALLAGGMSIAHAVRDPKLAAHVARAVTDAVERVGG